MYVWIANLDLPKSIGYVEWNMLLGNLQCNLMKSFIKKSANHQFHIPTKGDSYQTNARGRGGRVLTPDFVVRRCRPLLQRALFGSKAWFRLRRWARDFAGLKSCSWHPSFCQGGKKCDDGRHFDGLFGFGLWLLKNEGGGNTSGAFGPDARTHQQYFFECIGRNHWHKYRPTGTSGASGFKRNWSKLIIFLEQILRQYSHHYITLLVGKTKCATCTVKASGINFG